MCVREGAGTCLRACVRVCVRERVVNREAGWLEVRRSQAPPQKPNGIHISCLSKPSLNKERDADPQGLTCFFLTSSPPSGSSPSSPLGLTSFPFSGSSPSSPRTHLLPPLRILAELPSDSLGAYVISMARTASDVLAVVLLQRECGVKVWGGAPHELARGSEG